MTKAHQSAKRGVSAGKLLAEAQDILGHNSYLWHKRLRTYLQARDFREGTEQYRSSSHAISYDELAAHNLYRGELTPAEQVAALTWLKERIRSQLATKGLEKLSVKKASLKKPVSAKKLAPKKAPTTKKISTEAQT